MRSEGRTGVEVGNVGLGPAGVERGSQKAQEEARDDERRQFLPHLAHVGVGQDEHEPDFPETVYISLQMI